MPGKTVFKKAIDFEEAKRLLEQMRLDRGYPSGYPALDQLCGGLVKNGVTLIAARPAVGKTALALNIVSRLSRQQPGTILLFSPNTISDDVTTRLLGISMNLPSESFLDNKLPAATIADRFMDYYCAKQSAIKVKASSFLSLDKIWGCCCEIPDLRMVVIDSVNAVCKPVDYSTRLTTWGEPESPDVVFLSLQRLARYLKVPVICTSTLHRSLERRKNKRPRLGDLKKLGIPEALIDQVLFLYRDRYYDPEGEEGAEWIVAKVAQGNTGTLRLDWDHTTRRFTEKEG